MPGTGRTPLHYQHGTRLTTQSLWQRVHLICTQANLGKFTDGRTWCYRFFTHVGRYTIAGDMLAEGRDLGQIQAQLGHARTSTTSYYTGQDSQRQAIEANQRYSHAAHAQEERQQRQHTPASFADLLLLVQDLATTLPPEELQRLLRTMRNTH